jgi:hypothetical protein
LQAENDDGSAAGRPVLIFGQKLPASEFDYLSELAP